MSTLYINKDKIVQHKSSLEEILALLVFDLKIDLTHFKNNFINEGFITAELDDNHCTTGNYRMTNKAKELLSNVLIDSLPQTKPELSYEELAKKLKDIFPKGKKEGTNYYWSDGTAIIVRRLKLFFKKYGNTYNDDQIIKAAEKYVQGFNGNYQYMRLLKYFIFKEKVSASGEVEGDSELISYIENSGQEEILRTDWTSTLM